MVEVFERVLNDGFDFINNFATNSQDIRYSARIEEMTAVFRRREAGNRGRIANPAPMKAKTRSPEAPAPPKRFEVAWYCGLYRLRRNGKSSLWAKTNLWAAKFLGCFSDSFQNIYPVSWLRAFEQSSWGNKKAR